MGFGSKLDGMDRCMQYSLVFANIIFFICGICAIAVGSWVVADQEFVEELLDGTVMYMSAAYILIVIGIIVAIIAFLGCLGAMKENKCMLMVYLILLGCIFIFFLTSAILGFVNKDRVKNTIDKELLKSMEKYKEDKSIRTVWDDTQEAFKCCGKDSFADWADKDLADGKLVPKSCCSGDADCTSAPNAENTFDDGCEEKIKDLTKKGAMAAGAVGIVIALLLILGMIFSCCLYKSISNEMV